MEKHDKVGMITMLNQSIRWASWRRGLSLEEEYRGHGRRMEWHSRQRKWVPGSRKQRLDSRFCNTKACRGQTRTEAGDIRGSQP